MKEQSVNFLRYPGGKQRLLRYLIQYLPSQLSIQGRFVEPFIGGGAVFFALHPRKAILSDINEELIELYRGISRYPDDVWNIFQAFPDTKYGGPLCQDKKSACVKIQNPPSLLVKNLEGQVRFMSL